MFAAGKVWLKCVKVKAVRVQQELSAAERLNATINKELRSYGAEAIMRCVTQNTADKMAAQTCCSNAASKFQSYVLHNTDLVNDTYHRNYMPYKDCGNDLVNTLEDHVKRIYTTVMACVPKASILRNNSEHLFEKYKILYF